MIPITLICFSLLIFYCLIQILSFYGIGQDVYGPYLLFYIFLLISIMILPKTIPNPSE